MPIPPLPFLEAIFSGLTKIGGFSTISNIPRLSKLSTS